MRGLIALGILFVAMVVHAQSPEFDISESRCAHSSTSIHCVEYVHNHDGDTFTANIPNVPPLFGEKVGIRVLGIDAPEMSSDNSCEKSAAIKAQLEVQQFLARGERIDLIGVDRDKYFRILADVVVDGKSLSEYMLRLKLAVPYDGKTKRKVNWCRR